MKLFSVLEPQLTAIVSIAMTIPGLLEGLGMEVEVAEKLPPIQIDITCLLTSIVV